MFSYATSIILISGETVLEKKKTEPNRNFLFGLFGFFGFFGLFSRPKRKMQIASRIHVLLHNLKRKRDLRPICHQANMLVTSTRVGTTYIRNELAYIFNNS